MKNLTLTCPGLYVFLLLSVISLYAQHDSTGVASDSGSIVLVLKSADTLKTSLDSVEVVDLHPQDSPESRGFLIRTADGKSQLRFSGSIRLNGAYDFNGLQNQSTFSTYDIPVGAENKAEPRFFMSADQTRVGIEAKRQTDFGDAFMRIEADFLNSNGGIRLRHAFGQVKYWLGGQTWSTFSDVVAFPYTVDLDGPPSAVAERTVQIRYTKDVSEDFRWSLAAESPSPEISSPDSLQLEPAFQSFPDLVGRIRKYGTWGHFQLAAILRSITVKDLDKNNQVLAGFGGLLSGKIELVEDNFIFFQLVYGSAVARYVTALAGKGLDVVFNPEKLEFETLNSGGGFISYGHNWDPGLSSNITFGMINVTNKYYEREEAFRSSVYLSANIFWIAAASTRLGLEYSWGRKETKNHETGTANRVSFIVYYDF